MHLAPTAIPDVILESVPVDGFVCALGSDVRFRGKQLYSAALSQEQLRKVVQFYLEEKKYCILEGEDDVFVINPRKQSSKIPITSPDDFEKLYPGSLINIFTIPGRITDRERELFGDDFFFVEHPDFFEGALKGNSKSRGMEVILNHLGMTAQDCIAMGDSMNDYDMLKYAGISIAMEDSPEKLIAISDAVAKTADEGGVADALREFVLDK